MLQVEIPFARLITTIAIASLLVAGIHTNSSIHAQNGNPQGSKKWQALVPVDEAAEPLDTHKRTLRQAKNRRYNSTRSDQILTQQPPDVIYGRLNEAPRPPALPVRESDAVILGTVIEVQPYLTETKTSIYTEFTVRVEEAFKSDIPSYMTLGKLMVVNQEGGAIRLKDGRVLRYFVGGTTSLPSLNGRYILFLSLTHNHQDLAIVTGYELRNGAVISLEDSGDKSPYADWDEGRMLSMLRSSGGSRLANSLAFLIKGNGIVKLTDDVQVGLLGQRSRCKLFH